MAVSLLAHDISDLCLAKPALTSLPISATVADALAALKTSDDPFLSVWDCHHHRHSPESAAAGEWHCRCVGKVCMVDVICFLCRDDNLLSPSTALNTPVSDLLPKIPTLVTHLEPSSSLLEAIDLILQGAQNLVVPIKRRHSISSRRKQQQQPKISTATTTLHNGREFCWLTQEDVVRFLLSSIGLFSPIPALSIDSLGIITTDGVLSTDYHSPAIAALGLISRSLADQTSVAVVDGDGVLIGEISPLTLASCDETAAAAIATLSAGDLMAYIDGSGPPEDLVRVVNRRLKERNLEGIVDDFIVLSSQSSSSSSDEESSLASPTTTLARSAGRYSRSASYSARMARRAEAIVCHPKSSLVAVMIQAIAHRVNYVWVVDDDSCLVGIVTFSAILKVFREYTMP
ncbi:CBS domain-containing protein CBSX5 [Morus notabilis]|uniref:CBS domain-containing protein CBSX5 n=1 Tax=Morus notabilis TaxID=981085 RepID=W9RXN2_9ROSA|nr:CBS domain-containing protein CBSX5 [Morus notabilis]EXB76307.1 CBS domain-containing protein CBSX5 [Morus notabilis]